MDEGETWTRVRHARGRYMDEGETWTRERHGRGRDVDEGDTRTRTSAANTTASSVKRCLPRAEFLLNMDTTVPLRSRLNCSETTHDTVSQ